MEDLFWITRDTTIPLQPLPVLLIHPLNYLCLWYNPPAQYLRSMFSPYLRILFPIYHPFNFLINYYYSSYENYEKLYFTISNIPSLGTFIYCSGTSPTIMVSAIGRLVVILILSDTKGAAILISVTTII